MTIFTGSLLVADGASAPTPHGDPFEAMYQPSPEDLADLAFEHEQTAPLVLTMAVLATTTLRADLWANGYRPVPVKSGDKRPHGTAWQDAARHDPPHAVIHATPDALNTGILCDDLRALDIDIDDAEVAANVRVLAEHSFGETVVRFRENSPRLLMAYRAAVSGQKKRKVKNPKTGFAVEMLSTGQQFVAFGVHETNVHICWVGGRSPATVALADLPVVTEDQITKFLERVCVLLDITAPAPQPAVLPILTNTMLPKAHDIAVTVEDVRAALAILPDDGGDYDEWLRIGAIIHSVDNGSGGLAAFDEWSQRGSKYDRKGVAEQWNKFRRNPMTRLTAGSLIHAARNVDPNFITPSLRAHLDARKTQPDVTSSPSKTLPQKAERSPRRFKVLKVADILDRPPPKWLVPGLLVQKTLAAIYGPPASFKSFLALDIAMSLASGGEWNGRKLAPLGVAYVAAEGGGGLGKRARAWLRNYDQTAPEGMAIIEEPVALNNDGEVTDLIEGLRETAEETGIPVSLVVIDTLARCAVGVDENSSREMGVVIKEADRIKAELGTTVLLVHHTGKDPSKGMRGSNALLGATDTTIEITRAGSRSVTLAVRKQKDGEENEPVTFEMVKVDLPLRSGEEPQSSLVPIQSKMPGVAIPPAMANAISIATVAPVGVEVTVSKMIDMLGWKRGAKSYDRVKDAVPLGEEGVEVRTDNGMRRIVRVEGSKHEAIMVSAVVS